MPPPYHNPHWTAFVNAGYQPQAAVGEGPAGWALGLPNVPNAANLSIAPLNRVQVRDLCQDPQIDELFAYVCAMAWGDQSDRFARNGQPGHKTLAWNNRNLISPKLQALRAGGMNHSQAYNLFAGQNAVPGLGPSFFTKLIYFFSPNAQPGQVGFYIMDQWTAKSVDLLTQQWVVRLARVEKTSPGPTNKCGHFEAFCHEIESIAGALGLQGAGAGDQVEQRLMSEGGHNPQPWRVHVRANWPLHAPTGRYNRALLHATYPHIPIHRF
jgi:hypothetical protein